MKTRSTQKGFTLVELAIVMTIIGLLIGGVLKGQELMQNARVTSTVAQVKAYEAAVTTFRDKYDATPGDMVNAATRIPNCGTACNAGSAPATTGGGGDGIIGLLAWSGVSGSATPAYDTQTTVASIATPATAASTVVNFETQLFWVHLLLADLIGGVTNNSINATAAGAGYAWGTTHPAAKIAGGFVVGFGNGVPTPGGTAVIGSGISGMMLALLSAPTSGTAANLIVSGQQPLSSTRAAQIDRKMDDGRPGSGFVQAYGTTTSCFTAVATAAYAENITTNDCGLLFRIQG